MSRSSRIPVDFCERFFGALVPYYRGDIDCVLEFHGRIDAERLKQAFLVALAEEPMWSHRFVEAFWNPYWTPIPREEREGLFEIVPAGADYLPALDTLARRDVDCAAQLVILRGPEHDTLCFRVDHRLADATAARFLIDAVAAHFHARTPVPQQDQPLKRRTLALLRSVVSEQQRKENLQAIKAQGNEFKKLPVAFKLPVPSESDPAVLSPVLRYPEGALEQITQRAMRDRCTPPLVIIAATYLSVRQTAGIVPGSSMSMTSMVNLRRYLPPDDLPATASMLIGQARLRVDEPGANTIPAILEQLKARMAEQRGPQFGLKWSHLALDTPRVRFFLSLLPFAVMKWMVRKKFSTRTTTPDVGGSDLGEFGKPGDRWGDAVLQNGYAIPGIWGVPTVSICSSTCGSRLNIAVGASPRSFVDPLTAAIHRNLTEYVGWHLEPV